MSFIEGLHRKAALMVGSCALAVSLAMTGVNTGAVAQSEDYSTIEADPALWLITDEDSEVWLFGTFHILLIRATSHSSAYRDTNSGRRLMWPAHG